MDITKIPKGWRAIKASVDAANQAAEATRLASIPAPIKASEAYGQHEGKYLKSIPYDRMKIDLTTGARGGVGFSGLQHGVPAYAEARAASGVTDKKMSTRILNRNKDVPEGSQVIWTPSVGGLEQHKSNTTMFNQFADKFNKERKNLSDEQLQVLSDRASNALDNKGRLIFPEGIDLSAKNYRSLIKNYDQRGAVADVFSGKGVGGEKGRTVAVEKMLGENLDPYVADVPTGSLGNRLFTLDNGVIVRPDLHPDYPYILTGEDLGVNYIPVPRENVMETFANIPRFGKKTGEPRAVTDMDYRMGDPTQLLHNELLSRMQSEGYKGGGTAKKHGHSFEEDLAAAFAEVIAEHNPKPMHGEITVKTSAPVKMGAGGAITSDYNTVPDDNDGGAIIQNPSNFAKGGVARKRNVDELHPLAEVGFQRDIKNSPWYAEFVRRYQEQPDIREGGDYNYRKAWAYGAEPQRDPYDQNSLHWPSALPNGDMLKAEDHPTAWKEHFMREYDGLNPDSIGATKEEFEARQEKPIHMAFGGLAKRALRGLKGTNVAEGNKTSIIKDTGGNWLSGSVEKHLSPLRQAVRGATPADRLAQYRPLLEAATDDASRALIQRDIDTAIREDALDRWVGGNLTKYIKKQLGTADDPVRKLAEQGIVHKATPYRVYGTTASKRERTGTPQLGVSDEAKAWENLADYSIDPSNVGNQGEIHRLFNRKRTSDSFPEPWMAKVDPKTKVYSMGDTAYPFNFGYDHILDVLRADIAAGRIRPEQLSNVSMEQAVRRTHEFDQEMAEKMRNTQIKNTEGMPIKKDYADKGFKWQEITQAKELPQGWTQESSGAFVSPTGERTTIHPNRQALQESLDYEGNVMGHCVGDYGEDVACGKKRIFSLRDAKGEPHVTIETRPSKDILGSRYATENYPELVNKFKAQPEEGKLSWPNFLAKEAPELLEGNPELIYQMKAKQNSTEYGKYLPYVQDFIKGDPWTSVGDLGNTGLTKRGGKYLTPEEDPENLGNSVKLKPDGMAKGGLVHMAPGGVVKWASQLAKTINSHKMESMSGEQWMKWLNANAPKSAKKEALASGTLDWLPQQGKVSKGAIIEHMKANAPQIKTTKFENNPKPGMQARFEELRNEGEVRRLTSSERDEIEELEQKLEDTPKTKFDEHVLPGGKNYREMTMSTSNPTGGDYIVPGAHTYGITDSDINRILHMRMNDRPLAFFSGDALNIEELQSDWAQRGRSSGFKKPNANVTKLAGHKWDKNIQDDYGINENAPAWGVHDAQGERLGTHWDESAAHQFAQSLNSKSKGLPSGPYVTETEDWTRLGLHNAIKEAAEQGHSAVTWTGGEAQANRWSNEGLKEYYDTVMPSVSNDILKKMGVAERVGEFDVGTGVPHQGFNITPEMLEYIKQNGMPRFQDGGQAHYNKAEQVVESTQDLIDKFVEMYEKASGKEPKPPKEVFRDPWHMKDGGAPPRRDVSELIPFSPHLPSAVSAGLDWVKGKVLDEAKTYSNPRAIPDVATNVAADWAGMPVDIAKILADVADYGGEKVAHAITGRSSKKLSDLVKEDEHEKPTFGSSEYIKDYLKEKGVTTGTERPISEFAAFPVAPALLRGATRTGKKYLNQPPHLTQKEYDDILLGQSPRKLRNVNELHPLY
jgi:hypothetical protein